MQYCSHWHIKTIKNIKEMFVFVPQQLWLFRQFSQHNTVSNHLCLQSLHRYIKNSFSLKSHSEEFQRIWGVNSQRGDVLSMQPQKVKSETLLLSLHQVAICPSWAIHTGGAEIIKIFLIQTQIKSRDFRKTIRLCHAGQMATKTIFAHV